QADFLEIRAQKPTLMVTTTRDFFSIQGAKETANEVSKIYKAYGKPNSFKMVTANGIHESLRKNREAIYAFFQKYLDNPGSSKDIETKSLTYHELQSTKTGQVATSFPNAQTVFTLNCKLAKKE